MYRLESSGSSVSIICVIRSMPSVVTFRTWVSPRWNSAEPWARGMKPTSHEIWRISSVAATVHADALVEDPPAHDLLLRAP